MSLIETPRSASALPLLERDPRSLPVTGPRLCLLSANYGGGHRTTALALSNAWQRRSAGAQLDVIDYFSAFVSPRTAWIADVGYRQSVRLFPVAYRLFYAATQRIGPDSWAQRWLNGLGHEELAAYLQAERPDMVVAVHPTPAGAVADLRRTGRISCPVVTVITDYVVHSQWIHPGTDLYLVGCDEVRAGLIDRGIAPDRVHVSGIPMAADDALLANREELRQEWDLDPDLLTVMVMTGAQGLMRRPWRLYQALAQLPIQGFFLCGDDESLYRRLRVHGRPRLRPMPFTPRVAELMAASDVLVSKSGGLTTAEALTMELPMIVYHPIPGQEAANRDYLVSAGAALNAPHTRGLIRLVREMSENRRPLDQMRVAARRLKKPLAADDAAEQMLRVLVKSGG